MERNKENSHDLQMTYLLYIENPKDTITILVELIREFSSHRIQNQYTENNEKSEREIKGPIPFTIETKRIKYPGINLPKGTKELNTEKYKALMKEIKEDISR